MFLIFTSAGICTKCSFKTRKRLKIIYITKQLLIGKLFEIIVKNCTFIKLYRFCDTPRHAMVQSVSKIFMSFLHQLTFILLNYNNNLLFLHTKKKKNKKIRTQPKLLIYEAFVLVAPQDMLQLLLYFFSSFLLLNAAFPLYYK